MSMNGPLARAARALIQWPRSHVAKIAELDEETLARFEAGGSMLAASELTRLRDALERGGAVFIDEDHRAGSGVRLKFNAKDVRAINRMEGEGGPVGTDDGVVCGRGRNPTLRLWPTIFSGKIDVFPGDRRSRLISSMTSVAPA